MRGKRMAVAAVAALAATSCVNKPDGFGVDVEARTSMLPAATKNAIVTARLLVSGAETFTKEIPNAAKAAQSGAMKFRYVPGVHAGMLTIRVDGLDGGGNTVAAGISQPITLVDGKAVDALVFLATNGNGVPCMAMTDCISNNCVDGVCCESACNGVCETCNLPGQPGVCNPQMQGTDPDNDCAGKVAMQNDGGVADDDGGTGGGVTNVYVNPQACAGTCNGMRACSYAAAGTACGMPYCPASATVGSFVCDGNGSCGEQDSMCTDFDCDPASGACKSLCNSDADCQKSDFCNLNINKCVPKHGDGVACTAPDQCQTGFCSTGFCCNTDCSGTGQTCAVNPGQCQCQSHPCPSGVACQLFYKDGDADGYGDASGTLANGHAVAGCTGDTPPAGFVADHTDCDDADANAHPGQTAYFATPSHGIGTYDYNCDGTIEKQTPEYPGGSCHYCSGGIGSCTTQTTCTNAGDQSTLACGLRRIGIYYCFCCELNNVGFLATVACGTTGTLVTCGTCAAAMGPPSSSTSSLVQQCQ